MGASGGTTILALLLFGGFWSFPLHKQASSGEMPVSSDRISQEHNQNRMFVVHIHDIPYKTILRFIFLILCILATCVFQRFISQALLEFGPKPLFEFSVPVLVRSNKAYRIADTFQHSIVLLLDDFEKFGVGPGGAAGPAISVVGPVSLVRENISLL